MTIIRVKGLKRYKDRHGKWRCYHRKTGTPIKAEFGTGEFFTELAALNATVATKVEPKAGTLGGLMRPISPVPDSKLGLRGHVPTTRKSSTICIRWRMCRSQGLIARW